MILWATVAYDGPRFAGFQRQNDAQTVQGSLEEALLTIYKENITVQGCGRTDSGVHATGQVVSFAVPNQRDRLLPSLNALTPEGLSILNVDPAPSDFHPRFQCIAREYEYLIHRSNLRHPFLEGRVWRNKEAPEASALRSMTPELLGERDFGAFTRPEYLQEPTRRYLDRILVRNQYDRISGQWLLSIRIRGNAFLHNMIRIMVGTMLQLAKEQPGEEGRDILRGILESRDRNRAGPTAPASGLYFRRAYYPADRSFQEAGLCTLSGYPEFRSRK